LNVAEIIVQVLEVLLGYAPLSQVSDECIGKVVWVDSRRRVPVRKILPETRIHQRKAVTGSNEEPTNSALDQSARAKHSVLLSPSIRPLVGQGLCRLQPADDVPVEHRLDFDIADIHLQDLHFNASMPP
jgi:hypothetical protein